jgi:hypothetical protein
MQTANLMLAIGGDKDNTVPKFNVTASEIAVLRFIHGDDSVTEIEPTGEAKDDNGKTPTHRAERARLLERYGKSVDGRFVSPAVEALFPGAAARVFEKLDDLEIPDDFYKAERRVSRNAPAKAKVAEPEPEAEKPAKGKRGKKDAPEAPEPVLPPPEPEPEDDGADDGDGIGEMDDKKNLFG